MKVCVPVEIPSDNAGENSGEEGDGVVTDFAEFQERRNDQAGRDGVASADKDVEVDKVNPSDEVNVDEAERVTDDDCREDGEDWPVDTEFSRVIIWGMVVHVFQVPNSYMLGRADHLRINNVVAGVTMASLRWVWKIILTGWDLKNVEADLRLR